MIGVIFSASMGSTSGEINSLATVSVVDIYRRYIARDRDDRHYLIASRFLTVFWGAFAVAFAALGARGFGALIERVNIVGSLFYGGLLGVFVLAFFCKHVDGTVRFLGRARRRSGDLRGRSVYQHFVPLVQRYRLPRGGRRGPGACGAQTCSVAMSTVD